MNHRPAPMAWNYCPICGLALVLHSDGQSSRPGCKDCRRFYYDNPTPAACCIVTRGDSILLVRRAVEPCVGMWCLPGGFVETGETTEQAAVRELREETGIVAASVRLIGVSTKASFDGGAVTVLGYLVDDWHGEPSPGTDATESTFFPLDNHPPIAFDAHRELIAECLNL